MQTLMLVLHANWADAACRLWAESLAGYLSRPGPGAAGVGPDAHPFAEPAQALAETLAASGLVEGVALGEPGTLRLVLPADEQGPCPSDRMCALAGRDGSVAGGVRLRAVEIPVLQLRNEQALAALLALEERGPRGEVAFGHSLPFWMALARFVLELLADQR